MVREGKNPLAERRRERRVAPTFKEAALTVHAAHAATFKNAKHKAQWLASLEADVFPVFGDRTVDMIDSADVLKALSPIWTTKPETARRLKQRIKVVFDWAKASGHRSGDNPTEGLTKLLPKHGGERQHHAALPYQAVPAFLTALHTADTSESIRLAFEPLILTATRTNDVLGATWAEVDLHSKVWTIPGARMKTGREHRVPLSPRAVEIFRRAQECADGGPHVFPGRRPTKPLSNMAFLRWPLAFPPGGGAEGSGAHRHIGYNQPTFHVASVVQAQEGVMAARTVVARRFPAHHRTGRLTILHSEVQP
jgi:integrase